MTTARQSTAWISITETAGSITLRLGGELDLAACDNLGPAVIAAAEQAPAVELDLGGVTFCDSAGLALVINASEIAAERGHRFQVSRAWPRVLRLFEIADVQHLVGGTAVSDR